MTHDLSRDQLLGEIDSLESDLDFTNRRCAGLQRMLNEQERQPAAECLLCEAAQVRAAPPHVDARCTDALPVHSGTGAPRTESKRAAPCPSLPWPCHQDDLKRLRDLVGDSSALGPGDSGDTLVPRLGWFRVVGALPAPGTRFVPTGPVDG